MLQLKKLCKVLRGDSKGVSAVEVIIALAILGIVAVAFLTGLSTALKATSIADERTIAQSLARSQMEYVKSLPYEYGASPSYEQTDVPSPDHPDYNISVDAPPIDPDTGQPLANPSDDKGIQKIIVTIKHHDKKVFTLEGYKVDR